MEAHAETLEVFFQHEERAARGDLMEFKTIPPAPSPTASPAAPQPTRALPKREPESRPGHHGDKNETTFKINIYFY